MPPQYVSVEKLCRLTQSQFDVLLGVELAAFADTGPEAPVVRNLYSRLAFRGRAVPSKTRLQSKLAVLPAEDGP